MNEIELCLLSLSAHNLKYSPLKKSLMRFYSQKFSDDVWLELENLGVIKNQSLEVGCQIFETLEKQGIKVIFYGSAGYPPQLYADEFSPLWFQAWGHTEVLHKPLLAAVGSRDASPLTQEWIQSHLVEFLSITGTITLSGGARGVDQWVHGASVRKGLPTVVVLPSGLGRIYPRNLEDWTLPILERGGCLVSEFPFEQSMQKYLFHQRNHLIASLSHKALLLEGRKRSGSLITAQRAISLGKDLAVIPGHPLDPHFSGVLDLIFEGAQLIRDSTDLNLWFTN